MKAMNHPFDRLMKAATSGKPEREALRPVPPPLHLPIGAGADERAFDRLARSLAEEVPRREALRRLGAGLATALLASLGLQAGWGPGPGAGYGCGTGSNPPFSPLKPAPRVTN